MDFVDNTTCRLQMIEDGFTGMTHRYGKSAEAALPRLCEDRYISFKRRVENHLVKIKVAC